MKKIQMLIDPNNSRNLTPEALTEKILVIDQYLKNPEILPKTKIDLLKMIDELDARPGRPLTQAMETAAETCRLK